MEAQFGKPKFAGPKFEETRYMAGLLDGSYLTQMLNETLCSGRQAA